MRHYLLAFATLLALLPTVASAQTTSLTGSWQVDWTSMYSRMTNAESGWFSHLSEAAQQRAQDSFESRTYTFTENGTVTVSWQGKEGAITANGSWQLNSGQLQIQVDDRVQQYTVSWEASGTRLVLTIPQSSGATFSTFVLTQQ